MQLEHNSDELRVEEDKVKNRQASKLGKRPSSKVRVEWQPAALERWLQSYSHKVGVVDYYLKVLLVRVEICRDRRDRRSCKICASCVKGLTLVQALGGQEIGLF